jgi:diguanylate cyclase (GGDEF)-like protein
MSDDPEDRRPATGGGTPGRPGAMAGRDVGDLLQTVVAEVGERLGFWSADLWTFSEDADSLTCRAWWSRDPEAMREGSCVGAVVGLDQSHDLRRLVLAAEIVERHVDGDLSPADAAGLAQAGFTSRVDVPLLAGAEVLGVLSLAERTAVRRLSAPERELLGSLARLAAAVLRAAKLYEAEEDRAGHLTALLTSGSGLTASLSTADIVATIKQEAADLLPGVGCSAEVALRRDDGSYARVEPAPSSAPAAAPWGPDAVARQAAELGRPEHSRASDGSARLVVPLRAGGGPLGLLDLTAPVRRSFRAREVELAVLLAEQAASALERAGSFRAVQNRSATDTVTGLYSRWYFYERLYAEVARARRYREPLTLVLVELDGEPELVASRDPAHRDAVLAATARLVRACLRDKVDIACRLGAGRFALLLPSTPPGPDTAGRVAERIRARVAATHLSDDDLGPLGKGTVSVGVAGYPDAAEDADELAGAAEARLAKAVGAGGDRVEPPLPEPEEDEESPGDDAPVDEPA